MTPIFNTLKRNPVFKFMASVRLAVPLMLAIAAVVAAGTVYESLYNTQVARILVYRTWWFEALMILLWLNIFFAALSRIPYKKHHTGFVITHIGLLTLLVGGQITASQGIDGQLRVPEGQSSSTVVLENLVLKVAPKGSEAAWSYPVKRSLDKRTGSELGLSAVRDQSGLVVENYLPFVNEEQVYASAGAGESSKSVAVNFNLQSAFFNVSESLHSTDKPELQMGPAHLVIVTDSGGASARSGSTVLHAAPAAHVRGGQELVVTSVASGEVVGRIPVRELQAKPRTIQGVTIAVARAFGHATVASNKLVDDPAARPNPALELQVSHAGKAGREILFAKFPTFSLNPQGLFGLKFQFHDAGGGEGESEGGSELPAGHPGVAAGGGAPMGGGNTIEFHVNPADTSSTLVVLKKAGTLLMQSKAKPGDVVQTPWMGIKITVGSIVSGAVLTTRVRPTELRQRQPLPPSAIFVRPDTGGGEGVWLAEGDAQTLTSSRGAYEVYYGRDTVTLPFEVHLDQFRKTDYPGTETPMSFESTIVVNKGLPVVVKMNEPYQYEGHLLYQSSYEMGPGMPTASIFSVNKDPGRMIKYLGAIILILGIVIFTVMRSRWYLNRGRARAAAGAAATALVFALLSLNAPAARAERKTFSSFAPAAAQADFTAFAERIDVSSLDELPVQNHGRVKPLDSLARESLVFVTGKSSLFGLRPAQLFLGLAASPATPYLELVNIRDPELRTKLGFQKSQRLFTLQQLEGSPLETLARPLVQKQERDEKSLSADEKKITETLQQVWLLRGIASGGLLRDSVILDVSSGGAHGASDAGAVTEKVQRYLGALENEDFAAASMSGVELLSAVQSQPMPELFRPALSKMGIEVLYNHARLFLWVAILYMLIGVTLVSGMIPKKRLTREAVLAAVALPLFLHASGFAIRVYITGFAPVTNMYGTMVWMALGVVLFGSLLYALYRETVVLGLLLIGSATTLLLTESLPLVLSPDMDPIVAVLRNNFWLTIHVLTISISYAAFTITMLIGNASLVQAILRKGSAEGTKRLAHLAYRAMQLGVFLLTTGIILGGWWADYSWGRFWGWDPKETWALIADLGYIAILHARFIGWVGPEGLLAAAPLAYLLVIMAWYGVNFILASGLHSYGFSSGGATMVAVFVGAQLGLFAAGMLARGGHLRRQKRSPA